jgi:hypothetical protein
VQEERQAHAKASQQQLGKQAIEVQDGQQRTPGATPTASTLTAPTPTAPIPTASITPVEDPVQVHPLTFPPVFSLLFLNHLCLTLLFN